MLENDIKEYKKLVQQHPARGYLRHVGRVTERGNVTAITMSFEFPKKKWQFVEVVGIGIRNPIDEQNKELAKLAAMLHGLQQGKAYLKPTTSNK